MFYLLFLLHTRNITKFLLHIFRRKHKRPKQNAPADILEIARSIVARYQANDLLLRRSRAPVIINRIEEVVPGAFPLVGVKAPLGGRALLIYTRFLLLLSSSAGAVAWGRVHSSEGRKNLESRGPI